MKWFLTVVLTLVAFVTAFGDERKPAEHTLEGVLRVHPKFLYRHYIDGFGGGQSCALRGLEKLANLPEPGTRIRVNGTLGTERHEGGNEANPSPFSPTTYIYMDVRAIEEVGEADIALALAHRIAAGIEALKTKFPHLSDFSAEKHVQQNGEHAGFPAGSTNNPELASIAYFHGVLGERPPAPAAADGAPKKRAAETIFDPETGVRLYVHVFKGDSRGADPTPPIKVGDLSLHLYVDGPVKDDLRTEIQRVIDSVR